MLGLGAEVFAQRIHRNVIGCLPINKELESAEVLETTHEKAKFGGKSEGNKNHVDYKKGLCHPPKL